jgi:predicted transcriptional regulator of viral defense system
MKDNIVIPKDKKIYHTDELKAAGISYYKINKLVYEGKLSKLNKSHYENMDYDGEENDFYYIMAYTRVGIVCLLSAAVYYGLTNYRSDSIDVAIPKKKNVTTLPEWPVFSLYYFDDYRYNLGINLIEEGKNQFQIYDIEKTVIDIIYYRNRIGIEETKEILTNYLSKPNRDINQLIRYSKQLKCYEVLDTYLEVLI